MTTTHTTDLTVARATVVGKLLLATRHFSQLVHTPHLDATTIRDTDAEIAELIHTAAQVVTAATGKPLDLDLIKTLRALMVDNDPAAMRRPLIMANVRAGADNLIG